MSVIACRMTENGYEIAADSVKVRGWTQTKGDNTKFAKLFETNGMVIGSVGLASEVSIFRLFANTHKPGNATEAAILEMLAEFSEWIKNKTTSDYELENSYLIGFEGKMFRIDSWLVEEVTRYEAIGAGEDYALAALYLGHSAKDAVKTAIELSVYCEAPIIEIIKGNSI